MISLHRNPAPPKLRVPTTSPCSFASIGTTWKLCQTPTCPSSTLPAAAAIAFCSSLWTRRSTACSPAIAPARTPRPIPVATAAFFVTEPAAPAPAMPATSLVVSLSRDPQADRARQDTNNSNRGIRPLPAGHVGQRTKAKAKKFRTVRLHGERRASPHVAFWCGSPDRTNIPTVMVGVDLGKFRTQQEDLRGIVDP